MSLHRFKTSDHAVLCFASIGDGPPLILGPGWSQSAAMFHHQAGAFAAERRIITLGWCRMIRGSTEPTLVISGGASPVPPASQRWIARTVPGAQYHSVPSSDGSSHFMFLENPERFDRRVSAFLRAQ